MGHAGHANELLEIFGDELRTVVGDDAWCGVWEGLTSPLKNRFHVVFLHFFADFPVNQKAAKAIQNRAQEVKCARQIEMTDVDMPVLMGLPGLVKAGSFLAGQRGLAGQQSGSLQFAVNGRGTAGHDIGIEHHVT